MMHMFYYNDNKAVDTTNLFNQVSENLASIGCIPLTDYLCGFPPSSNPQQAPSTPVITNPSVGTASTNSISSLHHACQRTFGSIEALKFEFIEEAGQRSKKCILTISRPNGSTRSYATAPVHSRKAEAKSAAAALAIEMGALDFIAHGDPEELKLKRGLVLASINNSENQSDARIEDQSIGSILQVPAGNDSVKQIEECCLEWRGGSVAPQWVALLEPKVGRTQGCALRIALSPHLVKVYASDTIYDTYNEAKVACSEAALREGALDFIRHGNGQSRPASPQPFLSHTSSHLNDISTGKQPPLTLQAFYESLPRPFPESFESKDANAIGAPGYMNTLVQNARGGKVTMSFIFTSDNTPGLHGCFLRLDRPGEYRAYLVDPRFPKRSDAKAAVCLQALSHGVGDYVRAIGKAVESKVMPSMKSWANDQVYPILLSEYSKIRSSHPVFTYEKDKDAFGCTMTLQLANDPAPDQVRTWTAPSEYRNKADARVAVICTAVEQGAIEFIHFRGEPPPLGYTSPYSLQNYVPEPSQKSNGKRKIAEDMHAEHDKPAKRPKKAKIGGMQSPHEQTPHKDTHPRKSGNKQSDSVHARRVSEPGNIGVVGNSLRGYIPGPYWLGLGSEGTTYQTSQDGTSHFDMSMNHAATPNQQFMSHSHHSMQGGHSAPPCAVPSTSQKPTHSGGATGASRDVSSEREPGEVFDMSSGGVSDDS